jgi:polysaccharide export outer membrane protein
MFELRHFFRAGLTSRGSDWRSAGAALALGALLLLACNACKSPRYGDYNAPTGGFHSTTNLLQEGDLVAITFQYSTNFNVAQKIPLDGLLNLETVGPVKASGKTLVELQEELARLYKPQIKDDVVTVKLLAGAAVVYVAGAVFHPGRITMERPLTPLEAVMEAGGYDPSRAKLSAVTIVRLEEGRQKTIHLDLNRVMQGHDDQPIYLKPYDIVNVPTKTFNF